MEGTCWCRWTVRWCSWLKSTSNLLFLLVVEVIAVPLFYFFFLTTTTPSESFWLLVVPLLVAPVGVAGHRHAAVHYHHQHGAART